MITYRELLPDEYHLLADHPFIDGKMPDSAASRIIVAEDDGTLVGFQMILMTIRVEPLWVDPKYRNKWVAYRLWSKAKQILDHYRINMFFSVSNIPQVCDYLSRLGMKEVPGRVFVYEGPECKQQP